MVRKIDEDEILKAKHAHIPRQFSVSCFVAGLLSLPIDDKEFWVTVRIADKEWSTGAPKVVKPKFNRFNAALTANDSFITMPYLNIADIGTVYIYLNFKKKIKGDKRICFWKGNIMEFTNPNPGLRWIELEPDLAIGECKLHHKAGMVGIKLSIHDVTKDGPIDWMDYPTWCQKIPKRPPNIKVRVFCW